MGEPRVTAKAKSAPAKRGKSKRTGIEAAVVQWKHHYLVSKRAELELELARSVVKGELDRLGMDFVVTSVGTIALQHRKPTIKTDWEALARKLLPSDVIEKHVEQFTTSTDVAPVLAAPREWSAEAGR